MVALADALKVIKKRGGLKGGDPLKQMVAAVSVGMYQGEPVLDLDYLEDSAAETDLNVVMTGAGGFIEGQGTAEGAPFRPEEARWEEGRVGKGWGGTDRYRWSPDG